MQAAYPRWAAERRFGRHVYLAVTHLGGLGGHGAGPVPQPLGGVWAGLAKCLPRELPAAGIVVVDVDRAEPEVIAEAVARELPQPGDFEVCYRDGRRHVLAGRPAGTPPPARPRRGPATPSWSPVAPGASVSRPPARSRRRSGAGSW
ncbi:hypothetical protein [Streptomyces tendae]|uniref:hypothetical protein n=1 Tax=Streptomyces tendae TaxID=1932 RepID=UPI001F1035B3|nr:hypothetical protein [Streptomyces tendae]